MDRILTVDLEIESISSTIEIDVAETGGGGGRLPNYTGTYEVTPRKVEQKLATKNKSMLDDVTVNAIFYAEVSNPSEGYTATIGYE